MSYDRRHVVRIMDRGGQRVIAELTDIEQITWGRVRDDISTASVKLNADSASDQADLLRYLVRATGRVEMCVWRDDKRVWEGPITLPTTTATGATISARDVGHYLNRTIMHEGYDNSYPNTEYAIERIKQIMIAELARKEALDPPYNIVPHIVDHQTPTDARTSAKTLPYQMYVFQHLDSLAARGGIDYTIVGRAIHLWDTSKPAMGQTRLLTESDFIGTPYVSAYGMELATSATVTDGQGNYGTTGGIDPYYGEVELLATAYDEEASLAPTQEALESQSSRNYAGRNPTPLVLRVPDGSGIILSESLTIDDLVPGTYVPVETTLNLVNVSQVLKLQTMNVTETADGESITATFVPATKADEEVEA